MAIIKGLAGLVLGFGALSLAGKVYAQETPETPIIEQPQEKTYQTLEQELRTVLQKFIGHDKSLLPTLEQKLEETKSRLCKETQTPADLSARLNFLDTVKRDLDDYKVQFSTYEETFKTLTDMLDSLSEGKEVPGFAAKISFINRTKINKLTNPYLMAPKQDLFNLIDEIYKAESQRKEKVRNERAVVIQQKFEKIVPKYTGKEKLAESKGNGSPAGAVLYMGFDRDSIMDNTVMDMSGKGNHGVIYNAEVIEDTIRKDVLRLKDGGYVKIDSNPNIINGITLSAWIKRNGDFSKGGTIIRKSNAYVLYFAKGDNEPQGLQTYLWGLSDPRLGYSYTNFNNGEWYHIAATFDGRNKRLYVNGKNIASDIAIGNISTNENPIYIGIQDGSTVSWGEGNLIDEVTIFDRALTDGEILNLLKLQRR